jgi:hypothetical protein
MGHWWLMGIDQVAVGPVTTELVVEGIRAGKVPAHTLACEVGATSWRTIRDVGRFAPAFAKLRIDGPTVVDPAELLTDPEDPPTLANVRLADFDDSSERTVADASAVVDEASLVDDAVTIAGFEEVTIVDRGPRHSEPPM